MTGFLFPIFNGVTLLTNQGVILAGGKINTYIAGSTTPAATYTDSTLSTPLANPIILGSDGRVSGEIWGVGGITYKAILSDANNVVLKTYDNLALINDSTNSAAEWIVGGTPTYISATSFSLAGNQTATFDVGRRLKSVNTSGIVYSTIAASAFGSVTTVTVINDSGTSLDSGLSSVSYGFLDSAHPSMPPYLDAMEIISNATDQTKNLKFNLANLTTATTLTITAPASTTAITLSPSNLQVFTSTGTYTPTSGMRACEVLAIGGGAAGGGAAATAATPTGSSGGGGGSGEIRIGLFTAAQIGASQAVTIPAAATGNAGGTGSSGGNVSLGALLIANGGVGGTAGSTTQTVSSATGGAGGSGGTGGSVVVAGTAGVPATYFYAGSSPIIVSGAGASSMFGGGGIPAVVDSSASVAGKAGTAPGAGGSGASNSGSQSAASGGSGAQGIVVIREYF